MRPQSYIAQPCRAPSASRLSTSVQLEDTSPVDSALPSPALSPTVAGDEDQADEGDIYWPFRRHKSLSAYQSALTLFLVAWPVKCIFLLFVGLMGWVDLSLGLVGWILAAYGISVSGEAPHPETDPPIDDSCC